MLVTGDGSAQMTAREIGTLLRQQTPTVVTVVNNAGYTVERAIHGAQERYNDIPAWNWTLLPHALGGESVVTMQAHTPEELTLALDRIAQMSTQFVLLEAFLAPA